MGLFQSDRLAAARTGLAQSEDAQLRDNESNRAGKLSPIEGKSYGSWKKDEQKGWIREAKLGATTIYEPWQGPEGSSPINPAPMSQTMPSVTPAPGIASVLGKGIIAPLADLGKGIVKTGQALNLRGSGK